MSITRIINPDELRPVHVVMLGLVILAFAGNCLLTSAGKPAVLPDGAREWADDSLLLAIVEVLDLNYAQPTPNGVAIKALVHGIAAAAGLLIAALGIFMQARQPDAAADTDQVIDIEHLDAGAGKPAKRHIDPILAAQLLMLAYVLWSFASMAWSNAPDFAAGGSILLAVCAAWSFALAYGLNRRTATYAAYILAAVLALTGLLAMLYHGERSPDLRASYPIGNPIFLAAVLLAGVLVALAVSASGVLDLAARIPGRGAIKLVFGVAAIASCLFAAYLTGSRGPFLGFLVGILSLPYFVGGRRIRIIVAVSTLIALAAAGTFFYSQRDALSVTGRSASIRVRLYAWDYAFALFQQHPVVGNGQGGYALSADPLAATDVADDPTALEARVTHAHNEWIEVGCDLGSIGLVLAIGTVLLTLHGGAVAAARMQQRTPRLILIGLLAALVALVVEECFSVGLRIEGEPLVFFGLIGLIWAIAGEPPVQMIHWLARRPWINRLVAAGCIVACVYLAAYALRDFSAARAGFEVATAAQSGEWDSAVTRANQSADHRLSPQRKFEAVRRLASTHLAAAHDLLDRYLRRLNAQGQTGSDDSIISQLVQRDRAAVEQHLVSGEAAVNRLRAASPADYSAGAILAGLHGVAASLAGGDGNLEVAAQHRAEAAELLQRDLQRWPFDPNLAANYAAVAIDAAALPDLLQVLAKPLRYRRAPIDYLALLAQLSNSESYELTMQSLRTLAAASLKLNDDSEWQDPWIPEKLRLAAVAAFGYRDFARAITDLKTALELYPRLRRDSYIAVASCHAELADAFFFEAPDQPGRAIDEAHAALKYAPNSNVGRALTDALRNRLITYHLAADHEDFARQRLLDRVAQADDASQDRTLADAYVSLGFSVFDYAAEHMPDRLKAWSDRAVELAPNSTSAWFLATEVAIQQRNEDDVVRGLQQIYQNHGEANDLLDMVNRAVAALPESDKLKQMREELLRGMQAAGYAVQPPTATQPVPDSPTVPTTQSTRDNEPVHGDAD